MQKRNPLPPNRTPPNLRSNKIRKQGQGEHYRWCHPGTKSSYIALQEVVEREKID